MVIEVTTTPVSPLRHLHDTRVSVQKLRVQIGNRLSSLERGVDHVDRPVPNVYDQVAGMAAEMEKALDHSIQQELQAWPVYDAWLGHVKGIGPGFSGQLLAMLLPPIAGKGPSSWYKAAGLYTEQRDGLSRLPRARAGEGKITYHPWLRQCLWNIGESFVKQGGGGYYRNVYDQAKARLSALHMGDASWPPHRLHSVAKWKTVKLFLAHLWEAWAELEGIPQRPPYPIDVLGHTGYIPRPMPQDGKRI